MTRKVLLLVTVGQPSTSLLKDLEEPLATHLGLSAVASKTVLSRPDYAFNKSRAQYHCNAIMRRLVTLQEPAHTLVLGVTDVDLFVPDTAFVFGEADRESRSGVVSEARLRAGASSELLRRRVQAEVLNQAGHLLGLSYCEDARCVMCQAQTPQDVDRKQLALCNPCRNELQKLQR
ncbi:non-proteolytic archaemetzincin-like protein [Stigmatella sp. ncwal1]|uniref:Non-proteolytic archaemetzincin-like protein n=1 Tax=Stigmatella ashevillensis TaxID=2995309 RepID=A0ABT5DD87_9BACT|nr:non-proteolytic archaemetzincin-like protein [Stigmatella ashevillena]MDC0711596.1 non-proteolytic archaemetzincin-like protein [Stigmatella ashevillena]